MGGMDQKNLIAAIVLSVAIIFAFDFFYGSKQREQLAEQQAQQQAEETRDPSQPSGADAPGASGDLLREDGQLRDVLSGLSRDEALDAADRLEINTPTLTGSFSTLGGRLDDLVLTEYQETLDPDSPNIVLLSPPGAPNPYFANFGWAPVGSEVTLPDSESQWRADGGPLTPGGSVTLSWDNGEGLTFERIITVDEEYLFTVTQRVTNNGGEPVNLAPYGLVSRTGTPETSSFYILHEGMIGVFDEVLEEVDYDDLQDEGRMEYETTGGWIGITDKYWMATLVPDQEAAVKGHFRHDASSGRDKYQADVIYAAREIAPGQSAEQTTRLYAGAKKATLLDRYSEEFGITNFDRAVDFGWFYFLTKPIFLALHWLHGVIGNFGVAILILTVGIKLCFFPLANKSYVSMAKMRKLQPQMLKLRERFADDKQKLNQEMMALYKKEGANPLSGCLPILVQIPVFFALYKVLFVTIEMRHAPFFGWIQDLSARDPTSVLNLFGLLPWGPPELGILNIFNLGIWPLLMGGSMFLQQKLNPQPTDPMQAKIFLFMPIIFTFLLSTFPAGLVIYWTWNNTLSIAQQWVIMRRHGVTIVDTDKKAEGPDKTAGTTAKSKKKKKNKKSGAANDE